MSVSKTIIRVETPKTQSVAAVKALLAWKGRAADPLPEYVEMGEGDNRLVLVLSNKRDAYYVTTPRDCSCPAATYHRGPCKHRRRHFPEEQATTKPEAAIRKPNAGSWHGANGPIAPEEAGAVKVSASPLSVIDCHDTTALDVAYHSIKADRDLWPMVEA